MYKTMKDYEKCLSADDKDQKVLAREIFKIISKKVGEMLKKHCVDKKEGINLFSEYFFYL